MRTDHEYDVIVGTGGLGAGIFMALEGDHTLGREESRGARLLDQKDYCKLHNVLHYAQTLLGPRFLVVPIGKVGADGIGAVLVEEMRRTGFDMSRVGIVNSATLYSVCFLYPNGDGGNLTASGSASDEVTADDVRLAADVFTRNRGRGIAVALPEVPLQTRRSLLELATDNHFLRVAALVPGEVEEALGTGFLSFVDLLAVNLDEAAMLAGVPSDFGGPEEITQAAVRRLATLNPELNLVVTAGRHGSWAWDRQSLQHVEALKVPVVSTAGAGDAHLGGLLVALARGLDLATANRFASLVSGLKVTDRHTINANVSWDALREVAEQSGISLPPALLHLSAEAQEVAPEC